jgi:hypothetical protein
MFKNADPFTLAVHHVKSYDEVELSYCRKLVNGEDTGTSDSVGKNDTFNFRFKLEEGSDAELIVELGTVEYNGEYYDGGYPAYCKQILKIRGEEVHKKFNRSDRRGGDKNNFSQSYNLLKQAGIPQSEIDKVHAVLPKVLYEYERA